DRTRDVGSQFIYLRDVRTGLVWSATYQPTCREAEEYLVTFTPERAVFRRRDDEIEAQLEIAVSPEDDVEVRRLALTNRSDRPRTADGGPDRPRRPRAVRHRRRGAGSGRQLAPARTPAPGRLRAHVFRDRGRLRPRGRAGAGPEVPRPRLRRPHVRPRLYARA